MKTNITIELVKASIKFSEIEAGSVFGYGNSLYFKISSLSTPLNAADLQDGICTQFSHDDPVTPFTQMIVKE